MTVTATDKDRTAIPRWRPIKRVPSQDLASVSKQLAEPTRLMNSERQRAELWRKDDSLESAVDLLDLGLSAGIERWAIEGATKVLTFRDIVRDELRTSAERILERTASDLSDRFIFGEESIEIHVLAEKIRMLKRRALEFPRDSLIQCELARNYAILGQSEKSERHVLQALFMAPNNRYILRSATKFFSFWEAPGAILPYLRKAEGFNYDPWIQSAELASCQSADLDTRLPKGVLRALRTEKTIDRSRSELATGFALLELEAGLKNRAVNSILKAALYQPTENAMAQALWVGEHSSSDLHLLTERNLQDPQAWEARSRAFFLDKNFKKSEEQAVLWFMDQQLEVRAALAAAYLNLIHLNDARRAVSIAERAVKIHPRDWSLRNCAALSAAYSGSLDQAQVHIKAMTTHGDDPEAKVFIDAANGFIAFCEDEPKRGRKLYESAIIRANKLGRPNLVLNAAIFWLERESTINGISLEESKAVLDVIEKRFQKLAIQERSDTRATFEARKKVINDNLLTSIPKLDKELISAKRFSQSLELV